MPTKSRWTLPIPETTLASFLFTSPTHPLSDIPQFIDADRPHTHYLTHRTLRLYASRFAAGLVAAGLQPGEPVMLYSGNTLFFPVALLGVIMAGGIFTAANPLYTGREVAYQLSNSGARFLICSDAAIDIGLDGAAQANLPRDRVYAFDDGYDTFAGKGKSVKGCKNWTSLFASEADGKNFVWRTGAEYYNDTICLNYSSGTTGLPKGVEITHQNYISNAVQHMYLTELKPNYAALKEANALRWSCFLPMYHAMAQTVFCVGAVYRGIPTYIYRKFDFVAMLEGVQKFRISDLLLVPPVVVAMAKRPETKKYDLSSVVGAGSGAAPLGREITIEFEKLWPSGQVNLKQGYGMTEVTCSCLGWDPRKHCEDFSVGEPNANVTIKLVDPESAALEEVKDGERGEIWVQGPNVMKGYWRNEKATKETLVDGWLRTGDIAYKDSNGHFFVVDRMKELIKVKGMQVAPAELEAQLLEHPSVADVAVIGVTINGDEHPRAYVVAPPGAPKPDPKEIAKFMETKVTKHKWLTGGVKVVDEIKKNPSGKILRREYREMAAKEIGDSGSKESRL